MPINDYSAAVFDIEEGGVVVHYSSGRLPSYGVVIPLPADDSEATPEWLQEQIENESWKAFRFWDQRAKAAEVLTRRPALVARFSVLERAGRRRGPEKVS